MTKVQAGKDEALRKREHAALDELADLFLDITLYEPRTLVEPDPLRGIEGGWTTGVCHAIAYSLDGKRKTFSGVSAVHVLDSVRAWKKWNDSLKPDAANRWEFSVEPVPVAVIQRPAGDTAETAARRANTERRVLSWESGAAQRVDAHGSPIEESRASQYPTNESRVPE